MIGRTNCIIDILYRQVAIIDGVVIESETYAQSRGQSVSVGVISVSGHSFISGSAHTLSMEGTISENTIDTTDEEIEGDTMSVSREYTENEGVISLNM